MATRTVILSDLGGDELTDENHTRVVVKHPDQVQPLELDISSDEASKLVNTSLRLIEFNIYEPNKPPRTAIMESKIVDKLFDGVDFDKVLESARVAPISKPAAPTARKRAAAAPAAEKLDYTSPEHAGKLHRGRITDAEKEWVRNNQPQASYNREQQTGKPIDFTDDAEKKRYGME